MTLIQWCIHTGAIYTGKNFQAELARAWDTAFYFKPSWDRGEPAQFGYRVGMNVALISLYIICYLEHAATDWNYSRQMKHLEQQ